MKNKRQINIIKYLDIFDVMRTPDNGRISLIYEKAIHYKGILFTSKTVMVRIIYSKGLWMVR